MPPSLAHAAKRQSPWDGGVYDPVSALPARAGEDGVRSVVNSGVYNHMNYKGKPMKTLFYIIGIILILAGGTFFLQGISVLPGSYMTGDPQWAIIGGILIVIGIGLMIWAWLKNKAA
jgi:drug/metabolite transporter (DMT)-like permease